MLRFHLRVHILRYVGDNGSEVYGLCDTGGTLLQETDNRGRKTEWAQVSYFSNNVHNNSEIDKIDLNIPPTFVQLRIYSVRN